MNILRAILLFALLGGIVGCQSPGYNARVFHPWGCDDARHFKARMDGYKHVLMVYINEDRWEDRGPNEYSFHHYTGTVVRVYKGEWRVSEKISFVHGVDSRAPANPASEAGGLLFVFTSQHTPTEFGVDTGEFTRYRAEHAPALDRVFRK